MPWGKFLAVFLAASLLAGGAVAAEGTDARVINGRPVPSSEKGKKEIEKLESLAKNPEGGSKLVRGFPKEVPYHELLEKAAANQKIEEAVQGP